MRERGCFSTTILAPPRRPCRPRHPYAGPRTFVQCVCTRRRNCIEQSSPSPEYAPQTVRFPASATIKLALFCAATRTRQLGPCLRVPEPRLATMSRAKPAGVPAAIDGLCATVRWGRFFWGTDEEIGSRVRAACAHDQAHRDAEDRALQVGASGRGGEPPVH